MTQLNTSVDRPVRQPNRSFDPVIVRSHYAGKGPSAIARSIGMSLSFVRSRLRANNIKANRSVEIKADVWANDEGKRRKLIAARAARGAREALKSFGPPSSTRRPKQTHTPVSLSVVDFDSQGKVKCRPYSNRFREIVAVVSERHGISAGELTGRERLRELVRARAELCWMLHRYTKMSYPQIGAKLNRDHSSILHLIRKYGAEIEARLG